MEDLQIPLETLEKLNDKFWRLNNLYKIKDKNSNVIQFVMNRAQKHFYKYKWCRNIILKSRQLGFTTLEAIETLDEILWVRNKNDLFLSYDSDSALEIFDEKIMFAWENLPKEIRALVKADTERANKLKIDFGDNTNSSVLVRTKGRSGTFNRIHISEFGKICKDSPKKATEIVSGTFQTVPYGDRIDIESTAEGEFGRFHDMFWDAYERGEPTNVSEFKAHFYNWQWDDEGLNKIKELIPVEQMEKSEAFVKVKALHDLTDREITYYYLKWIDSDKDWDILHQEFPITPEEAFVASGTKLFDQDAVQVQKERYGRDGEKKGNWTVFSPYQAGHIYGMGGDPSEGIGGDNSGAAIWDFTLRPRIVATLKHDKLPPEDFAHELREGGLMYKGCLIGVERNNHGHAVLQALRKIYDPDLIFKEIKVDKETDQDTERFGWLTTAANKPRVMHDIKKVVNDDYVEIPCKSLLREMRTYDREDLSKVKPKEDDVKHWDLLMAAAIGYQMKEYAEEAATELVTFQQEESKPKKRIVAGQEMDEPDYQEIDLDDQVL